MAFRPLPMTRAIRRYEPSPVSNGASAPTSPAHRPPATSAARRAEDAGAGARAEFAVEARSRRPRLPAGAA
jgi:hypothetical protein